MFSDEANSSVSVGPSPWVYFTSTDRYNGPDWEFAPTKASHLIKGPDANQVTFYDP